MARSLCSTLAWRLHAAYYLNKAYVINDVCFGIYGFYVIIARSGMAGFCMVGGGREKGPVALNGYFVSTEGDKMAHMLEEACRELKVAVPKYLKFLVCDGEIRVGRCKTTWQEYVVDRSKVAASEYYATSGMMQALNPAFFGASHRALGGSGKEVQNVHLIVKYIFASKLELGAYICERMLSVACATADFYAIYLGRSLGFANSSAPEQLKQDMLEVPTVCKESVARVIVESDAVCDRYHDMVGVVRNMCLMGSCLLSTGIQRDARFYGSRLVAIGHVIAEQLIDSCRFCVEQEIINRDVGKRMLDAIKQELATCASVATQNTPVFDWYWTWRNKAKEAVLKVRTLRDLEAEERSTAMQVNADSIGKPGHREIENRALSINGYIVAPDGTTVPSIALDKINLSEFDDNAVDYLRFLSGEQAIYSGEHAITWSEYVVDRAIAYECYFAGDLMKSLHPMHDTSIGPIYEAIKHVCHEDYDLGAYLCYRMISVACATADFYGVYLGYFGFENGKHGSNSALSSLEIRKICEYSQTRMLRIIGDNGCSSKLAMTNIVNGICGMGSYFVRYAPPNSCLRTFGVRLLTIGCIMGTTLADALQYSIQNGGTTLDLQLRDSLHLACGAYDAYMAQSICNWREYVASAFVWPPRTMASSDVPETSPELYDSLSINQSNDSEECQIESSGSTRDFVSCNSGQSMRWASAKSGLNDAAGSQVNLASPLSMSNSELTGYESPEPDTYLSINQSNDSEECQIESSGSTRDFVSCNSGQSMRWASAKSGLNDAAGSQVNLASPPLSMSSAELTGYETMEARVPNLNGYPDILRYGAARVPCCLPPAYATPVAKFLNFLSGAASINIGCQDVTLFEYVVDRRSIRNAEYYSSCTLGDMYPCYAATNWTEAARDNRYVMHIFHALAVDCDRRKGGCGLMYNSLLASVCATADFHGIYLGDLGCNSSMEPRVLEAAQARLLDIISQSRQSTVDSLIGMLRSIRWIGEAATGHRAQIAECDGSREAYGYGVRLLNMGHRAASILVQAYSFCADNNILSNETFNVRTVSAMRRELIAFDALYENRTTAHPPKSKDHRFVKPYAKELFSVGWANEYLISLRDKGALNQGNGSEWGQIESSVLTRDLATRHSSQWVGEALDLDDVVGSPVNLAPTLSMSSSKFTGYGTMEDMVPNLNGYPGILKQGERVPSYVSRCCYGPTAAFLRFLGGGSWIRIGDCRHVTLFEYVVDRSSIRNAEYYSSCNLSDMYPFYDAANWTEEDENYENALHVLHVLIIDCDRHRGGRGLLYSGLLASVCATADFHGIYLGDLGFNSSMEPRVLEAAQARLLDIISQPSYRSTVYAIIGMLRSIRWIGKTATDAECYGSREAYTYSVRLLNIGHRVASTLVRAYSFCVDNNILGDEPASARTIRALRRELTEFDALYDHNRAARRRFTGNGCRFVSPCEEELFSVDWANEYLISLGEGALRQGNSEGQTESAVPIGELAPCHSGQLGQQLSVALDLNDAAGGQVNLAPPPLSMGSAELAGYETMEARVPNLNGYPDILRYGAGFSSNLSYYYYGHGSASRFLRFLSGEALANISGQYVTLFEYVVDRSSIRNVEYYSSCDLNAMYPFYDTAHWTEVDGDNSMSILHAIMIDCVWYRGGRGLLYSGLLASVCATADFHGIYLGDLGYNRSVEPGVLKAAQVRLLDIISQPSYRSTVYAIIGMLRSIRWIGKTATDAECYGSREAYTYSVRLLNIGHRVASTLVRAYSFCVDNNILGDEPASARTIRALRRELTEFDALYDHNRAARRRFTGNGCRFVSPCEEELFSVDWANEYLISLRGEGALAIIVPDGEELDSLLVGCSDAQTLQNTFALCADRRTAQLAVAESMPAAHGGSSEALEPVGGRDADNALPPSSHSNAETPVGSSLPAELLVSEQDIEEVPAAPLPDDASTAASGQSMIWAFLCAIARFFIAMAAFICSVVSPDSRSDVMSACGGDDRNANTESTEVDDLALQAEIDDVSGAGLSEPLPIYGNGHDTPVNSGPSSFSNAPTIWHDCLTACSDSHNTPVNSGLSRTSNMPNIFLNGYPTTYPAGPGEMTSDELLDIISAGNHTHHYESDSTYNFIRLLQDSFGSYRGPQGGRAATAHRHGFYIDGYMAINPCHMRSTFTEIMRSPDKYRGLANRVMLLMGAIGSIAAVDIEHGRKLFEHLLGIISVAAGAYNIYLGDLGFDNRVTDEESLRSAQAMIVDEVMDADYADEYVSGVFILLRFAHCCVRSAGIAIKSDWAAVYVCRLMAMYANMSGTMAALLETCLYSQCGGSVFEDRHSKLLYSRWLRLTHEGCVDADPILGLYLGTNNPVDRHKERPSSALFAFQQMHGSASAEIDGPFIALLLGSRGSIDIAGWRHEFNAEWAVQHLRSRFYGNLENSVLGVSVSARVDNQLSLPPLYSPERDAKFVVLPGVHDVIIPSRMAKMLPRMLLQREEPNDDGSQRQGALFLLTDAAIKRVKKVVKRGIQKIRRAGHVPGYSLWYGVSAGPYEYGHCHGDSAAEPCYCGNGPCHLDNAESEPCGQRDLCTITEESEAYFDLAPASLIVSNVCEAGPSAGARGALCLL